MNNMKTPKFQSGGPILDEDELFDDSTGLVGNSAPAAGSLDGELVGGTGGAPEEEEEEVELDAEAIAAAAAAPDYVAPSGVELSGVEQFLTAYGVQGGIITYEDGSSARFSDLDAAEQSEILSSLVTESVPTIEEKYNLDADEINLLNTLRDSDMTSEEFINSLVDYRMQAVAAQRELSTTDYTAVSADGIFVKSLRDSNPDISDEEIAAELAQAKELTSYTSTTEAMRKLLISEQQESNYLLAEQNDKIFSQELEAQRFNIVEAVEDINDIAGAQISSEMKEFLLHDIMELNENKDPILMEKLFSSPDAMFKANWFLNYGESYMQEVDNHWKREVSKARKEGYLQATTGMPGNPVNIGGVDKRNGKAHVPGSTSYGKELSEEELFEQEEN